MNDKIYKILLFAAALIMPIVCGGVVYALVTDAYEAFEHFGFFKFLTSSEWSYTEGAEQYGALPFITGTLMTTLLALIFCIPFSLPVALFVGEYFKGTKVAAVLSTVTDLLAGIPSIIYGLWGFYTLRPIIMALDISPQGSGILTASLVLAIMIIPYAASLSAEFIKMYQPTSKRVHIALEQHEQRSFARLSSPLRVRVSSHRMCWLLVVPWVRR